MNLRVTAGLFALLAANPAWAKTVASAESPGKTVGVTVSIDTDGRPSYAVTYKGKPLVNSSALGFLFTDAPKMDRNFELIDSAATSSDTSWTQPFGEWTTIRDNHTALTVRLREAKNLAREMDVTFHIFDNGVGFRYTLPEQPHMGTVNIAEELTQFALAEEGTAWWKPAFEWNREEYLYGRTPISAIGTAQTVLTVRFNSGTHVALHEAALVDYAAINLARVTGTTLKAVLTPGSGAPRFRARRAFQPRGAHWQSRMMRPGFIKRARSRSI
jgi:alpha-glucosidase